MKKKKSYDWNKLYAEYITSGLTINAFATSRGIPNTNLYRNFKRIAETNKKTSGSDADDITEFIPVTLVNDVTCEKAPDHEHCMQYNPITLTIKDCVITLSNSFDKSVLSDILEVIRVSC